MFRHRWFNIVGGMMLLTAVYVLGSDSPPVQSMYQVMRESLDSPTATLRPEVSWPAEPKSVPTITMPPSRDVVPGDTLMYIDHQNDREQVWNLDIPRFSAFDSLGHVRRGASGRPMVNLLASEFDQAPGDWQPQLRIDRIIVRVSRVDGQLSRGALIRLQGSGEWAEYSDFYDTVGLDRRDLPKRPPALKDH